MSKKKDEELKPTPIPQPACVPQAKEAPKHPEDPNTKKLVEYEERLKRLQAEFENYKKRVEKEKEESTRLANRAFVNELVSLDEAFEQGLSQMGGKLKPEDAVKGIKLIRENLQALLRKEGVEFIAPAIGERFDVRLHEAAMAQKTEEFDEGSVVQTIRKGYKIGHTVIKPAMVVVSKSCSC